MAPIPPLLQQFLRYSCAFDAAETVLLWQCLPLDLRQRVHYRIERLGSRKPFGQASDTDVMTFLQVLNPMDLVEACEAAVLDGRVSRAEIVTVQEKLLAEMLPDGRWK